MAAGAVASRSTPPESLADLLKRLGDISPRRVRMAPAPGTATAADVLALESRYNRLFELVDGVLVEKAMGFRESLLAGAILELLRLFVRRHKLGIVVGPDGMMQLSSRLIRIPDVAFVSWSRMPGRKIPKQPIPRLAPDLAIEVLSQGNTAKEMAIKRREYFNAGVLRVWEVDPKKRSITVYLRPDHGEVFREGQVVDGGPVLPGFKLSVSELFGELDQSAD